MGIESDPSTSDPSEQVLQVLQTVVHQRTAGEQLSDEDVLAQHPELADSLASGLAKLRAIELAGVKADDARTLETLSDLLGEKSPTPRVLQIRCPNCHEPQELAPEESLQRLSCADCGSQFGLAGVRQELRTPRRLAHFDLLERVGRGSFGAVWKGRDTKLDRNVAVKVPHQHLVDDDSVEKFLREARLTAQLKHPNIASVYEVGQDEGAVFIVSDYIDGISLDDWLLDQQLTSRESAELCIKIANALHHAHEQGIVHRDLKPANIMMDADNEPHLMDFGLARRDAGEVTVTVDGQVLGTPAYMSPEQAAGDSHAADCRSDIYSLGVILFELLTGELPFRGNARMLMQQVMHDEPPSPRKLNSNIPRDLETITLKCLEKEPSRRYHRGKVVALELQRFLKGAAIIARPPSFTYRLAKFVSRHRVATFAGSSFAAFLVGTLFFVSLLYFRAIQAEDVAQANRDTAEQAQQDAILESNRIKQLLDVVLSSFKSLGPWEHGQVAESSDIGVLLRMQRRVLEEPMPDSPLIKASLLAEIGNTLFGLGYATDATESFEQCLELRRTALGNSHHDTLRGMIGLARCYEEEKCRGNNDADWQQLATVLYDEAVHNSIEAYGPDARITLRCRAAPVSGQWQPESVLAMEDIVRRADRSLGVADNESIRLKHNLAVTYAQSGRSADAVKLYLEVLRLRSKDTEGEKLMLLGNLGGAYHALGDFEKALEVLENAHRVSSDWFGPHHSYTAAFLQGVLIESGKYQRAEEVLREWLNGMRPRLRDESRNKAWANVSLAEALLGQMEIEEALALAQQALSEPRISPEEADRAKSVVGACYSAEGNLDTAEPLLLESFNALHVRSKNFPFAEMEIPYKRFYVVHACKRVVDHYRARGDSAKVSQWEARLADVESEIQRRRIPTKSASL